MGLQTETIGTTAIFYGTTKRGGADEEAIRRFQQLTTAGATHVVGSYLKPHSVNVDAKATAVNVTGYDLTVGVRIPTTDTNDPKFIENSEKAGNWRLKIGRTFIER